MDIGHDRKDLQLTRAAIMGASQQERVPYGEVAKEMRKRAGLTQEEVSERSGVTARTIRNIENGVVAGQAEKLIRIFIALGVDLDGSLYSADVQRHLHLVASMLARIDPAFREEAVAGVVVLLADALQKHPAGSEAEIQVDNVTHAEFGGNVPTSIDDLPARKPRTTDLQKIAADMRDPRETDQLAPGEHPED